MDRLDGVGPGGRCSEVEAILRLADRIDHGKRPISVILEGAVYAGGDGCAPSGTRTPNPLIKSQLLCQLS